MPRGIKAIEESAPSPTNPNGVKKGWKTILIRKADTRFSQGRSFSGQFGVPEFNFVTNLLPALSMQPRGTELPSAALSGTTNECLTCPQSRNPFDETDTR